MYDESDSIISIGDKKIDCSKLSDEKLLELYKRLKERESALYKRIMAYDKKYNLLSEMDINDII